MVFGDVKLHRDLIPDGDDTCHGGGFWRIDNQRGCIILSARSFDFGPPEFLYLERLCSSRPIWDFDIVRNTSIKY